MKEEIKSLYSRVKKSENLEKRLSGVKIPEEIDDVWSLFLTMYVL